MNASFEELLERDGKLTYRTRGTSMNPMLRQDRDLVTVEVPKERLKPGDAALYKRGDKYVLHRVLRAEEGYYLIRGDNTYALEKVPEEAVLGVLTSFVRKGKTYRATDRGYLLYVRVWCVLYPVRFLFAKSRRLAVAFARRLGLLPLLKRLLRRESRASATER